MQFRTLKRLVVVFGVTAAAGAGAAGYAHYENAAATAAQITTTVPAQSAGAATPVRGGADFSAIVAQYGPAVVNISVSGSMKTSGSASPFPGLDPNDPFSEFFRRFRIPQPQGEMPTRGMGSGFIVAPNGIVLTNAHVVAGADEVTVKLTDKREFKAKVLGLDKATDVAVLRIDADKLPTVRLGDPAQTRVGEWVLAIGAPFGFENTATAGIVSAKSRSLPDEGYVPFIQTDVAVNPGNSGGPLFNTNGEVIGINSQIYSHSGGYQGLSFAIPIDVAMKVQQQIVAHGKAEHGLLGVTVQDVNQSLAEAFGLKQARGALISAVQPGGPAAKAKLETGDVILALNGTEISRSSELPPLVGAMAPGAVVNLNIWRKGESRDIKVTVGDFNDGKLASADDKQQATPGRLGVAVRPLTPEEQRQAEVAGGLLVQQATGAAARAGIQPGDVILALNGEPITSVENLRSLVAKAGKRVALLVQRNDGKIFVPVDLG
jgi:serine protease Do